MQSQRETVMASELRTAACRETPNRWRARHTRIVMLRNAGRSYEDIGRMFAVSPLRVAQIEAEANAMQAGA
jgi:DNA-directed RNA polymerase sigma subunit (sigma70/sigma32)